MSLIDEAKKEEYQKDIKSLRWRIWNSVIKITHGESGCLIAYILFKIISCSHTLNSGIGGEPAHSYHRFCCTP